MGFKEKSHGKTWKITWNKPARFPSCNVQHSWKKCRPHGGLGQKFGDSKTPFFGKKYRKHIIYIYVYIYTESSSRVWNCFPEKPKKHAQKKRNRHFGAEIWHPNGSRYKNPVAAFIYLLNPEIWVLSRWLYPWRMVPPLRNGFIGGSKHPPAVRNYPVQNVCCMMFDFPTESVQGKV